MKKWDVNDFNRYKQDYENLSFNEKLKVNQNLSKMFPEQSNWNVESFLKILEFIEEENLKIIEIGSWDGEFAFEVVKASNSKKIYSWQCFD